MRRTGYSKNYIYDGKRFRYNYDEALVELIYKNEDGEWEAVDAVGLRPENWENKEIRDQYLFEYSIDLEEEMAAEMAFFRGYGI